MTAPSPRTVDAAAALPGTRPRVLVADDEEGTRALMAEMLSHSGFDVVQAHDGTEALARARATPPDLALVDVMMPGMDGREVCRRMGADPALTHVPVILHSSADERDVDWRGVGADAFLQKPFRIAQLPEFVRRHLSARSGQPPRARRLTDDEVRALAVEIRRAVRMPRSAERNDDVLAPRRELSPEDEARVEAALLDLLMAARDADAEARGSAGDTREGSPTDDGSDDGRR
jgi:DNA-binding response OmpR family regulator